MVGGASRGVFAQFCWWLSGEVEREVLGKMHVKGGRNVEGEGLGGPLGGGAGVICTAEVCVGVGDGVPCVGGGGEEGSGGAVTCEVIGVCGVGVGEAGPWRWVRQRGVRKDWLGAEEKVMGERAELAELVDRERKDADIVGCEVCEEFRRRDGGGAGAIKFAFGGDVVCSVS